MGAIDEVLNFRFSRERYERMIEAGLFAPEDRIELLDGEIVLMPPQKSRHATAITLLQRELALAFVSQAATVRVQLPLALSPDSEPEPDIAVVAGVPRDYRDAHPQSALLIVEVSDATRAYDRGRKLAAYARAGIPEYWLLDVAAGTLEVCRTPLGEDYRERRILLAGEAVAPLAAPAAVLRVEDLLP